MYGNYQEIACLKDCGNCPALSTLGDVGGRAVRETLEFSSTELAFREVDVRPEEAHRWAASTLPYVIERQPTEAEVEAVSSSVLRTINPDDQCETVFDSLYE
jgi:hypothetical protein